jgi:hypothetical protein
MNKQRQLTGTRIAEWYVQLLIQVIGAGTDE